MKAIVGDLRNRYDDRFSHYFPPDSSSRFRKHGGPLLGRRPQRHRGPRGLRVANVFDDTPAEEAGIRDGDMIVSVDGHSIAGEDADARPRGSRASPEPR